MNMANFPRSIQTYFPIFDEITEAEVEQLAKNSSKPLGTGGSKLWERAKRFVELKKQLQWDGEDALALLNMVFDTSRWGGAQLPDPETARLDMEITLAKASEIYQEFQAENPDSTTQQQLKEIAGRLRYQIATREPFATDGTSDLQVATLWGAKGVTADHVYVMGLCNEAIPGTRRPEYPGTDSEYFEEQRLPRSKPANFSHQPFQTPHGRQKDEQSKNFRRLP